MDRDGAIKLLDAAAVAGVRRYLMISGAGVENPPDGDGVFDVYLRAKAGHLPRRPPRAQPGARRRC